MLDRAVIHTARYALVTPTDTVIIAYSDRPPHSAHRAVPTGLNPATLIADHVTIEPYSVLRACRVESHVLIGARSVICEGAIIESGSILTPGSVVPPARRIPSGELWGGNPAKYIRKLTEHEVRHHGMPACKGSMSPCIKAAHA